MKEMQIRSKVWFELGGEPFLGDGRARLLALIDQQGSITAAAKAMGISYRKAWGQLQAMELQSPWPLVERSKGGSDGGRSQLTAHAQQLLQQFECMREGVNEYVDERFRHSCGANEGTRC